jgi:hypothetical protein
MESIFGIPLPSLARHLFQVVGSGHAGGGHGDPPRSDRAADIGMQLAGELDFTEDAVGGDDRSPTARSVSSSSHHSTAWPSSNQSPKAGASMGLLTMQAVLEEEEQQKRTDAPPVQRRLTAASVKRGRFPRGAPGRRHRTISQKLGVTSPRLGPVPPMRATPSDARTPAPARVDRRPMSHGRALSLLEFASEGGFLSLPPFPQAVTKSCNENVDPLPGTVAPTTASVRRRFALQFEGTPGQVKPSSRASESSPPVEAKSRHRRGERGDNTTKSSFSASSFAVVGLGSEGQQGTRSHNDESSHRPDYSEIVLLDETEPTILVRVRNGFGVECRSDEEDAAAADAEEEEMAGLSGAVTPTSVPRSPRASAMALQHMSMFSEDTVFRVRDVLAAACAAVSSGQRTEFPTNGRNNDDDHDDDELMLRSEWLQEADHLRAAIASGCGFHPSFTHARLSLLAAHHAVCFHGEESVRMRLVRSASIVRSQSMSDRSEVALGTGVMGAIDSSEEHDPALNPLASSRGAFPLGLGVVTHPSLSRAWLDLAQHYSPLEARVHSGLFQGVHVAGFRVFSREEDCVGVGLVSLAAGALSAPGGADAVASAVATSGVGHCPGSIGLYSDGIIARGGCVEDAHAQIKDGDVVVMVAVPVQPAWSSRLQSHVSRVRQASALHVSFVHWPGSSSSSAQVVHGGVLPVGHGELVFPQVTISTHSKNRVRVDGLFTQFELRDAHVIEQVGDELRLAEGLERLVRGCLERCGGEKALVRAWLLDGACVSLLVRE